VGLAVRDASLRTARTLRTAVALVIALGCAACTRSEARRRDPPARGTLESSPFVCAGTVCSQRHVRLPDDGEWRCAERDGVVWCAGGEPAAGVVLAASARGYRCGDRRGAVRERVCVDAAPDYPDGGAGVFRCRFEQERGVTRVCTRATSPARPLPVGAAPNCWVDADCGGRCERGTCVEAG
jgi:hypothetical protein